MSRYSDINLKRIERSDKAEALNYLSKYYELMGELDKAEETLKTIISEEKSWSNYRLLIDLYTRTQKYTDIEKIYLGIIENNLGLIEDKVDFFYNIHQFYMQFQKAYDAALIYIRWSRAFFPEEMALAIEHDIYFGLGMSDIAIRVADVLIAKYGKKEILDYYYAINYMYLLEFEKASECLNIFKEKYSPNLRQNLCTNKLEDNLQILQGKKRAVINKEMVLWLDKINTSIQSVEDFEKQISSICVLEDITLYIIFKMNKVGILKKCKKIFITAKAVRQIVDVYCETENKILIDIIEFIKGDPRVIICSPRLENLLIESLKSEDDMTMLMTKVLAKEIGKRL